MEQDKVLLITISIQKSTGQISNISNIDKGELPLLYRALRALEGQIFEDITREPESEQLSSMVQQNPLPVE